MRGVSLSPSLSLFVCVFSRGEAAPSRTGQKKGTRKKMKVNKKRRKVKNSADEPAEVACLPTTQRRAAARGRTILFVLRERPSIRRHLSSLFFFLFALFVFLVRGWPCPAFFRLFFMPMVIVGVVFFRISIGHEKIGRRGRRRGMRGVCLCSRASAKRRVTFAARQLLAFGAPFGRAWANEGALQTGRRGLSLRDAPP